MTDTLNQRHVFEVPEFYALIQPTLWLMSAADRFIFEKNFLGSSLDIATGFLRAASKSAASNSEVKAGLTKELLAALSTEIKGRSASVESIQPNQATLGAQS